MRTLKYSANRKYQLKKLGLSVEDYNTLLKKQNYGCAICQVHEMKLSKKLAVDHDHKTGRVRGLLCDSCNRGIGLLEDSSVVLRTAAEYLNNG